ncbi:amidase family protein [Luteirhabdus pelagi]|uniref:amidase family protein n=1 Tax=Luteirhabdus pelagi TaxID=2792783 RepID=UPI001939DAC2|nr:amidase family protein [Luteirhabdus pelagi]
MRTILSFLLVSLLLIGCKTETEPETEEIVLWNAYDETEEIAQQQEHETERMRFKVIQSVYQDKNEVFQPLYEEVSNFSEERYAELKPLVLEQDIATLQQHITEEKFTYEELTLFYLKRIYNYELDAEKSLHTIMALNPNAVALARERDKNKSNASNTLYGMPILLKDNIDTKDMKTTAGAKVLEENQPSKDAFIVQQLRKEGAIILGKVNLSEWAYYFCQGCPLGYSAVGGQTLNPYGRKEFETGGSSAGSGTATAANYAVAAVGTETAGSIISPSSQNSLVGLKPTVGVLSRTGIIPISHTLDTPGPMAKSVMDAAILLEAMSGKDASDTVTVSRERSYVQTIKNGSLEGIRLGVFNSLMQDSIYAETIKKLEKEGAEIVSFDPPEVSLNGFLTLLNLEMKEDLPKYLAERSSEKSKVKNLQDIMAFNQADSVKRMPYDQGIFDDIMADSTTVEDFKKLRSQLQENGTRYFEEPMEKHNLDAILSINNYHSAYAAVAHHPCLTLPMGYKENGEPINLTLISAPFTEVSLLRLGYAIEKAHPIRKIPSDYSN